ncbi:hypothetical protein [Bartonella vinsonii]|uniref:hypothetical protein n=1 Tax=Bartonella vinsonii TaxID=33047 RepID=UPI00034A2DF6|nr:hypothetical protein [Bartonella vinsonii]
MHKKRLFLCTTAYAFFLILTSHIQATPSLSPQTRYALEGFIKLPEQYRHLIDLTNIPTASEKTLEKIASSDFMGGNSYFDQMLQKGWMM